MSIESAYIWMDGEFVPFHDAKVHILSHSLHYGLGVFEGADEQAQRGGVVRREVRGEGRGDLGDAVVHAQRVEAVRGGGDEPRRVEVGPLRGEPFGERGDDARVVDLAELELLTQRGHRSTPQHVVGAPEPM